MRQINLFLLIACVYCLNVTAQNWKWSDPQQAGFPVIQNQGWTEEIGNKYVRLPDRAENTLREAVWNLSRHSAGLAIHFYCDAPEIKIQYGINGSLQMPHMPATGVAGIDLYSINSDGEWNFCFGNYSFKDTIQYHYTSIPKDRYHKSGYEYRLHLPLFNEVTWMEIGIPDSCNLSFLPLSPEKPIAIYGTSIVHGACASRPGMAWTSIMQRSLDYPLINLGFSGNALLEKEVIDLMTEVDARLFILDCMPNLTNRDEGMVVERLTSAVKKIREKYSAPILLIEHAGTSNPKTNMGRYEAVEIVNQASLKGYQQLISEGIKEVYYLSRQDLDMPADGWVDQVHPNDLGMYTMANSVERKVREILRLPVGNIITTQPVTQRREPHNYEWRTRHRQVLAINRNTPPETVILGNSITHFWGGEPEGPRKAGAESWDKYMEPAGFRNLGYGWDRIENVLWRVYHDELSGFDAKRIVMMIGTNNMGINSDEEIIEGLRFLLAAIKERQPEAIIQVMGILPRRDHEEWVVNINRSIRTMVEKEGYTFRDAGNKLVGSDGKIDESFFSDGLHPNEKGYHMIAPIIAE